MRAGIAMALAFLLLALLVPTWLLFSSDESSNANDLAGPSSQASRPRAAELHAERVAPVLVRAGREPQAVRASLPEELTAADRMRLWGTFVDEAGAVVQAQVASAELERDGGIQKLQLRGTQVDGGFDYWFPLREAGGSVRLHLFVRGYVPVDRVFAAVPGTAQRLAVVFRRGGVLRGQIVDELEAPVAGVKVSATVGARSAGKRFPNGGTENVATSDAQGLFALQGMPTGPCTLHSSSQHASVGPFGLLQQWRLAPDQQVRPGDTRQTFVAQRLGYLGGSVRDGWGLQWIEGGHVHGRLTLQDGRSMSATSGIVRGRYTLRWELPPDCDVRGHALEIEFSARGYESRTLRTPDVATQEFDSTMVLLEPLAEPALGSAWLQIVDAEGLAVDLVLSVMRSPPDERLLLKSLVGVSLRRLDHLYLPARVRTLGQGRLEVRAPVGIHWLTVAPQRRAGRLVPWRGDVTFERGPKKWTTVRLPPMTFLEIPAERPSHVTGITLNRSDLWGLANAQMTLPPGRVRLALAPGTWHVQLVGGAPGGWQVLKLAAGTTTVLKLP